jgi:mannose-6-phosphate isomerase-like protein (cupin superfamily)
MFTSGQTIENAVTREQIRFLETAAETGGAYVVVDTLVRPGGAVATRHIHPHQTEHFEVLEGEMVFHVGRERVTLTAGEAVTVPAGTPHAFRNAGAVDARFRAEVSPALQFEELLATMFALAAEGRTNDHGMPNPLQLAVIADAYWDTIRVPFPPALVQRLGLALMAPLARLCGYRADAGRARRTLLGAAGPAPLAS